jgi:hypothetical protein
MQLKWKSDEKRSDWEANQTKIYAPKKNFSSVLPEHKKCCRRVISQNDDVSVCVNFSSLL